jgi:FKBP-type peptidyl-prolyl cis-trans isomerase
LKKISSIALFIFCIQAVAWPQSNDSKSKIELKNAVDSVSYSIGVSVGKSFRAQEIKINSDIYMRGILEGIDSLPHALPQPAMDSILNAISKITHQRALEKTAALKAKNLKDGQDFLAANRKKDSVHVTDDSLQYKILRPGKGPHPTLEDTVTVNYIGRFLDGTEFDNSYKRNSAATFPLGGVIHGWGEGLQLMSAGAKFQFVIPPALAYGESGFQGIPPNSTLIFDVELVSFK